MGRQERVVHGRLGRQEREEKGPWRSKGATTSGAGARLDQRWAPPSRSSASPPPLSVYLGGPSPLEAVFVGRCCSRSSVIPSSPPPPPALPFSPASPRAVAFLFSALRALRVKWSPCCTSCRPTRPPKWVLPLRWSPSSLAPPSSTMCTARLVCAIPLTPPHPLRFSFFVNFFVVFYVMARPMVCICGYMVVRRLWCVMRSICSRPGARQVVEVSVREERPSQPQCGQAAIRPAHAHFGSWSPHWPAHQLHVSLLKHSPSLIWSKFDLYIGKLGSCWRRGIY